MNCENIFCIYQLRGKCTVEDISIDSTGMCMDCIYPNIDEKILTDAKNELLKKFDERM